MKHRRAWQLLGSMLATQKKLMPVVVVLILIVQLASALAPAAIGWGIDYALPKVLAGDFAAGVIAFCVYAAIALIHTGALWLYVQLSSITGQRMLYSLRVRMFRHTQRLSADFYDRYATGRIISRQTNDTESLRELLESGVDLLIGAPVLLIFTLVAVFVQDFSSGWILLASLLPVLLLTRWFVVRSLESHRDIRTHSARLTVDFIENLTGIKAILAYGKERKASVQYEEYASVYGRAIGRSIRIFGIYQPLLKLISNFTVVAVLIVGGIRVAEGAMQPGVLLAIVLYVRRFFVPIDLLSNFANVFQSAYAALEKISALLAEVPSIKQPEIPKQLPQRGDSTLSAGDSTTKATFGQVEFRNVKFCYKSNVPVIDGLNFVVNSGESIALVGRTGSGKSTVAKLISRFYDVTNGSILIDGVDVRDLAEDDLRSAVVMLVQESYLFSGSVMDNILLGKPGATYNDAINAAKAIGAHEFIENLPHGYDTDVQGRGGRLSAGQKQLISFARAFLTNPRVLIVDEATSSLDLPSERALQKGFEVLLGDKTTFVIAHRLSTVLACDRVFVMEKGRVVEDGSPLKLIKQGGHFASLHKAWQDSL